VYSERVTSEQLAQIDFKVKRYSVSESQNFVLHFNKLKRSLNGEEQKFVKNERILCKYDFLYWANRYAHIHLNEGGVGLFSIWPSQELVYKLIKELEEESWDQVQDGAPAVDGICFSQNKARQLGATSFARLLIMHRLTLWENTRGMAASIDMDKILELYDRDKLIYDSLPGFLKPELRYDKKGEHLHFEGIGSKLLYQEAKQQSGIGQGRQFEVSHLTELSAWPYPTMLRLDFFPTIPYNYYALSILESTPYGRNWWREFTFDSIDGKNGRWHGTYVPYYINSFKYWRQPPEGWEPAELTKKHMQLVEDTSPQHIGKKVSLLKEQAYWWEVEREISVRKGELNLFLTNYSAVPEESFQHTNASAFDYETIEKWRLNARKGVPYLFEGI
jgi:hypothetical protein